MILSEKFTVLLDANVLYPAPLRDYLLSLAEIGFYKPLWTERIQYEWIENLLLKRPELYRTQLEKTREAMNLAFPDSNIVNYDGLIPGLSLPDDGDRHILAAAIYGKADALITFNLPDFPTIYLKSFDIEVMHPDAFVASLIGLDRSKALSALENQLKRLKILPSAGQS